MSKGRKIAAAAVAGVALLAASPASAMTVAVYYGSFGEVIGYIYYGNDGHVCLTYGNVAGRPGTIYTLDGDC
jgi:hypothetical protein